MTIHTEDFAAERARLRADLSATAVAGGDTSKIREKIAKLDEREQAASEAAQAALEEQRRERAFQAIARAAEFSSAAALRLTEAGFACGDDELNQLALAAQEITRFDVEAEEIGKQRAAAFEEVARIEARIDLMTERVNSLRDLRLTGQASARDDADADRAEADLKVLRETHAAARAAALAIDTPPSMVAHAKDALANLARVEKSIRENQLRQRIAAAEDAYLHAVAALFAERGARTNAQAGYLPSAAMEKYTRLGMLDIR